jgi:regulator of cell morphogenesis and NO signaling
MEVLTMLSTTETVAQVVLDHSECAEVFQRHRIDFCCRGGLSLATAALERGVDVAQLVRELDQAIASRRPVEPSRVQHLGTAALIDYVVETHHAYLRRTLPFLRPLAAKVARVHGGHNPNLRTLDVAVAELCDTLLGHIDDEEQVLFPALLGKGALENAAIAQKLAAAQLLERIRAASEDFALPEWACNSYRTLFGELQSLERDIFTHVHLENHVLAPRFAGASPAT